MLTTGINKYTIDRALEISLKFKETKRKQMKRCSIHSYQLPVKQAGFMPTYWSVQSSNDRTPEICQGSREDRVV